MAKKPYKCKVSGRVCPFDDGFFEMADAGEAKDSCPIQQYENSNHTKEDGTRVINDWCKHLVERKQENKRGTKSMVSHEKVKLIQQTIDNVTNMLKYGEEKACFSITDDQGVDYDAVVVKNDEKYFFVILANKKIIQIKELD